MGIAKTIEDAIKNEYNSGKTQLDIAFKHNLPPAVVSLLLRGKRKFGGITLATLDLMYPHAEIILHEEMREPEPATARRVEFNQVMEMILADNNMSVADKAELIKRMMAGKTDSPPAETNEPNE